MNRDLQATYQILSLFEKSKALVDRIFDQSSGIHAIVDEQGTILRANIDLARALKVDHEDALGLSLEALFKPEAWKTFAKHLHKVGRGDSELSEFELSLDGMSPARSYLWQVLRLEGLIVCNGRDVTDLKMATAHKASLEKDLLVTQAVQSLLIPKREHLKSGSIQIASSYKSAAQSGGDWWWHCRTNPESVWVLLGDVTGHGAGSAMITSLIAGCVHTFEHLRQKGLLNFNTRDVFEAIHERLSSLDNQPYWMTLFSAEILMDSEEICWWSASAPPPLHLRSDGSVDVYFGKAAPLGSMEFLLSSGRGSFKKGDRLFLFTDGVYEFVSVTGRSIGFTALKRLLLKTKNLSTLEARDLIETTLKNWRGSQPLTDDAAYVIVDWV